MDWVDLLMQIDFLHEETTEWDSNDPLPLTIVTPDRFDVVGSHGQGIQRLPKNKTYLPRIGSDAYFVQTLLLSDIAHDLGRDARPDITS
jgi:hypothetical protein